MHQAIIVTGTPGTGKTALAKTIAQQLGATYIDIKKLIKPYHLAEGYDKNMQSYTITKEKLVNVLINVINASKKILVIDGHLSHYLPKKYVQTCIVTTCTLPLLQRRLKKRNYTPSKIKENLEAELCNACLGEARDQNHNIIIVDTTHNPKNINWKQAL
ncbi:MAG TPA: adenylate kinase family protein [Candidatus Nanoarchaeia archaeon]|nr:adenylate kinase family protein [Candidatus Nanoarchaeia archaeon]